MPEIQKCHKHSVSLFDNDMKRIDRLIDFMAEHSIKITRSEALKLALRATPINDRLLAIQRKAQKEDKRRKSNKK